MDKEQKQIRTVDYDHILSILREAAEADKTAREAYQLVFFAFGE
jgi:hypothetical protein